MYSSRLSKTLVLTAIQPRTLADRVGSVLPSWSSPLGPGVITCIYPCQSWPWSCELRGDSAGTTSGFYIGQKIAWIGTPYWQTLSLHRVPQPGGVANWQAQEPVLLGTYPQVPLTNSTLATHPGLGPAPSTSVAVERGHRGAT